MLLYITILAILLTISNLSVTVYLHRALTHRSVRLHSFLNHFFRFSLWMLTPFPPKIWIAVHRYHHKTSDTDLDPHSPLNGNAKNILTKSAILMISKKLGPKLDEIIDTYSKDFQNTKLELFYLAHPYAGKFILLLFLCLFCGFIPAITIWTIVILWMIIMEERVHVVLGHLTGYRNYNTNDNSKNIVPWAIFLFGEELHNNHHAKQNDWSFRKKWYEIDPAAVFIQICIWLKLAYVNKI